MIFRRLHPDPGTVEGAEAVAGFAHHDVLVINMVASADGRAAAGGVTAPLSDPADRELFHLLRAHADAILVGTGTMRAERYGRFTKNERLRELRVEAGLDPEALGVTMTHSMNLPYAIPLFQDPETRLVVYTTSDREPEDCAAQLDIVRWETIEPPAMLADLRERHGVHSVLCEGGPTINGPLFASGAVDELFFTISPALLGGHDPLTILEGEVPAAIPLELAQVLEHDSTLLLRYRVGSPG